MVELGIFESVKPLKHSKALSYSITKYFYENLKKGLSWRMSRSYDSQDPFSRNEQSAKAQSAKKKKKKSKSNLLDALTMVSPFKAKYIPPLFPGKNIDLDVLESNLGTYLCTDCCSHRLIRMPSSTPGTYDILQTYAGTQPSILLPPFSASNTVNF